MATEYAVGAGFPQKQGLYDPGMEKDACGVGFIADMTAQASRRTVVDAIELLRRLSHRGACGCDENSGDGAGILTDIPHAFFRRVLASEFALELPKLGEYAVGNVFFPQKEEYRAICQNQAKDIVLKAGLDFITWRQLDVDNSELGAMPRSCEPVTCQMFVKKPESISMEQFSRTLYLIQKRITNAFGASKPVYICSLSNRTIVYKGQLTPSQVMSYFKDLQQDDYTATIALVHSRFSTNTFPSWERAQPFRYLAHNGEINSLRGNVNWMRARQGIVESPEFGSGIKDLFPVIESAMSDSGMFDNVLQFLVQTGRDMPESVMMMIPEAWQNDENMSALKKEFYEFHSAIMEPWDGPALVAFTDGQTIGAVLDRNGLRPGRFYVTSDKRVICASEVGVIDLPPEIVIKKGRLRPGHMFLVDVAGGSIISDSEIKSKICSRKPYGLWLKSHKIQLQSPSPSKAPTDSLMTSRDHVLQRLKLFGYTVEALEMLLQPMAASSLEALGSMGNDLPLACLSLKQRNVFEYFKQLFAQVTNPPIDPIREQIVTSLASPIGPESNLLQPSESCCHRIFTKSPVLLPSEFASICSVSSDWKPGFVDILFEKRKGKNELSLAISRACEDVEQLVLQGIKLVVLSDRNADKDKVPIMSALAIGAVHHYLVHKSLRSKIGLIAEVGDAREVHHFCVLLGFGVDCIFPYTAFQAIALLREEDKLSKDKSVESYWYQFKKAVDKGIIKVMAKMGVSTLQSYKGAQIFEALGIHQEVIDLCFTGCSSRISGVGFDTFAADSLFFHELAYPSRDLDESSRALSSEGYYHWRQGKSAELHLNDPQAIAFVQQACRSNDVASFRKFTEITNRISRLSTLRGLFKLKVGVLDPVPLSEVEPVKEIVKRFCTGAMSLGSISNETHTTVAIAMNRIGGKSNSGEGGEQTSRFQPLPNGDFARSAIKQVASARFGVTINYLTNSIEIQIKISQGAKPGEGGELPGYKVQGVIAKTRRATPGVGLISPPPHHDIYSIEDLAQLIYDLKNANPSARVSVKLVSEVGVGVVAAGVTKGKADHILISGHDGGTGASRWTSIKHAGLPWELGLAETHQTLVQNGLRDRVVIQADGQMKTGLDVIKAALLGAEEFGFGTQTLIALGCIMMRKCHLNTCPVGVATQDPELRKKFSGKPEHLINYFFMVAQDCREIMASLGFRTFHEMIGRADMLEADHELMKNEKLSGLDLSAILHPAFKMGSPYTSVYCTTKQDHGLEHVLDRFLLKELGDSIVSASPASLRVSIKNTDRAVGGTLSHEIVKIHGEDGLPDGTIKIKFDGHAGQSFGAWLAAGVQFELEGDANDYVGKGLSGGRIVIYPPKVSSFNSEENAIAGNVLLYGATSGEAFIRGVVAERFCVRNSGALVVVEGVGDHGCEYMTRGTVVILGPTGRNFAAGMSGGIAYIYDETKDFPALCNLEMVDLDPLDQASDQVLLRSYIQKHFDYTGSTVADELLKNWGPDMFPKFWKVFPKDYKSALANPVLDREEKPYVPSSLAEQKDGIVENSIQVDTRPNKVEKADKNKGFMLYSRGSSKYRDSKERVNDFKEIYEAPDLDKLHTQSARCMDCGVPFCHQESTGCPLGNRIPEWNDLVHKGRWKEALDRLLATNNFPEFTGRVCPAPCEGACVLGIIDQPVTIKNIECTIIDHAFAQGWIVPSPPKSRTGKKIAVVGSGPAGLAAGDQLNKVGHKVTVFERHDRIGGLLMYGVPNMKLDKEAVVERRVNLMKQEGIEFIINTEIGSHIDAKDLIKDYDAVVFATGATIPRDLPIKNRKLKGYLIDICCV